MNIITLIKLDNPLQMNDWEIKKFLKTMMAFQLAFLGAVIFQLSIIEQVIGFIYLNIPGIIFLRILRLHKLGNIVTLLYSVGLSIIILMFIGLFMNITFPIFGIIRPISANYLTITISLSVLILCLISYFRDKNFASPDIIDVNLTHPLLFLCIVPFLSIFGAYMENFYHNNILLMITIIIIAILIFMVAINKLSNKLYPIIIFIISISLLFHYSLMSTYLTGWDIHQEYFFSNLVNLKGFWDSSISSNVNGMLSIVILPNIYSQLLRMDITWVFKIIYPIIFSLLPLGLYHIYREQTDEKIAFFSAIYMVSIYTFYTEMVSLARQEIAEIMLLILILIIISKQLYHKQKILLVLFSLGLIVSHYGTTYIFLIFILGSYVIMTYFLKYRSYSLTLSYLIFFSIAAISWYILVTSGSIFNTLTSLIDNLYATLFNDIGDTHITTIVYNTTYPVSWQVLKMLYLLTQFFIFIGIIKIVLGKRSKFHEEYLAMSIICFGILSMAVLSPSVGMNIHRLYQMVSIFLSPFCIIGGNDILKVFKIENALIIPLIVILFFLFNVGIISEIIGDQPISTSLSYDRIKKSSDVNYKASFYDDYNMFEQDDYSTRWLSTNLNYSIIIYSDYISSYPLNNYLFLKNHKIYDPVFIADKKAYIYSGYANIVGRVTIRLDPRENEIFSSKSYPFVDSNMIYSNGGSNINLYFQKDIPSKK